MDITEFEELDPVRVDAVGQPANGIDFLVLKSLPDPVHEFADGLCGESGCSVCAERYLRLGDEDAEKAKMKAKERNALSDSQFAFPKQRKEPLNDAAHVRNAIARFSEVEGVSEQERKKAARRILKRAKALGIEVSEDSDVARTAKKTAQPPAPDAQESKHDAEEEAAGGGESDGRGDTAPDKDLHLSEAERQTEAEKAEPAGDHGSADSDPGSSAWEDKDVALGERAERLVSELAEVVRTFTEREKAEGRASKHQRRVIRRVRSLLKHPTTIKKEFLDMSATEALMALDAAEKARREAKKSEKAKKAAKAERKAAKAAKAAKAERAAAKSLEKRLAALEAQPASRPFINGAGLAAALRGPQAGSVFAAFDERIEQAQKRLSEATSEQERRHALDELRMARKQRAQAKLVANANAQYRGELPPSRFGPNTTELFASGLSTLPDDPSLLSK